MLFVGRLVADKGVPVLLDAWRRLGTPGGPVPGRRRAAARTTARTRRRARRPVERALPTAYAAADLVVVPSIATRRFLEPWGLVCNEAMSQGRPVIATDAVGAAAGGLVRDGETGLVVAAGDAAALSGAMGRLLGDRELRERLGAAGREEVAAYTYEAAADGFAEALRAVGVGGDGP